MESKINCKVYGVPGLPPCKRKNFPDLQSVFQKSFPVLTPQTPFISPFPYWRSLWHNVKFNKKSTSNLKTKRKWDWATQPSLHNMTLTFNGRAQICSITFKTSFAAALEWSDSSLINYRNGFTNNLVFSLYRR